MRWWDEECIEDEDSVISDPLLVERSRPVTDEEATHFEEICHAATPGPLVVDDKSAGGGTVIASLPDGHCVVSQSEEVAIHSDTVIAARANAELICRARCMVLRLLRDRRRWQRREQSLLGKIASLEARIEQQQARLRGRSTPHPR